MSTSATTIVPACLDARRVAGDPAGEVEALAAGLSAALAAGAPEAWRAPGFARRVDAVRAGLTTARSRSVLAASFEREACRLGPATSGAARRAEAVRAAYAVRWLELGSGTTIPAWSAWLDGPDERQRAPR